mmetsp:Transcript_22889/g.73706  ORF Transcript_22889/g.73706 Transcript_22889/m.73706 type:complete len:113 (+) Transcript_22889:14-352(+)
MEPTGEFQLAHAVGAAVFAVGVAVVSVARCAYGTWNPVEAHRKRMQIERLRETIADMKDAEDELRYHEEWAKSRGDFEEARKLKAQLPTYEARIRDAQEQLQRLTMGKEKHS